MANTYSNVGGTGSGEANTASSRGADPDKEIVAGKEGVDLKFKRLKQGANITLSDDADTVTIAATGGAANAFSTIVTSPVSESIVADSDTDTLTFTSTDNSVSISGTAANDTLNLTVNDSQIDHDFLQNFNPNEHVNHALVTITGGGALTGGGTITSSRTITLDINNSLEDVSPDSANDFVLTYDASEGNHKKVRLDALGGGGATQLNELTDVNTAGLTSGDVLAYDGFNWVPTAPAAGGGGFTTVADAGTIGGSIDGDVLLEGNATLTSNLVIRGNLYFAKEVGQAILNGENLSHDVTVFGNVICNSNNTTGALINCRNDNVTQASVTIHGSCINTTIYSYSAGNTGIPGGDVFVGGDFLGNKDIYTYGGSGTGNGGSGGNAGSITIEGSAVMSNLFAYGGVGGANNGSFGGNGSIVTVSEDLIIESFLDIKGANTNSGDTKGGDGGTINVGGNFTYKSGTTINMIGGNNGAGGAAGGDGGNLVVGGSATLTSTGINATGGLGLTGGSGGNFSIGGDFTAIGQTINAGGGFGFDTGGNAASSPSFKGKVNIGTIFLTGGNGSTTAGIGPTDASFNGGGYIFDLNISEGSGTSPGTTQTTNLREGNYIINTITRKTGITTQNAKLRSCTLIVNTLSDDSTLTDSTGGGIRRNVTSPETKMYKANQTTISAVIINDTL